MDPGALIGAGGQVGGEFLDPVLSAQGDAGGDGGADGVVALHLGGGAQGRYPPGGGRTTLPRPPCGPGLPGPAVGWTYAISLFLYR